MQSVVAAERTPLDPIGAGALLAGVLFTCVGLGAALGVAAGSVAAGIAVGSVIGIPAAILAVYFRYRDSM
jgi:ABC-type nitrate/sulfonate/bicarbonate transport system permease component